MMTFPTLPEKKSLEFEHQRSELIADAETDRMQGDETSSGNGAPSEESMDLAAELLVVDALEAEAALKHSIAGRMGTALEKASRLAGFDWRTNIALVGGFAAKEIIVSTLGTAYSLGDVDPEKTVSLSEKLSNEPDWRPLTALSLILFVMFYSPCFVSVVCIVKESGSWKWGAFSMVFNTFLAFFIAVMMFQTGSLMGF